MSNYTIFVKSCVVLHHLATLFNNINAEHRGTLKFCNIFFSKRFT